MKTSERYRIDPEFREKAKKHSANWTRRKRAEDPIFREHHRRSNLRSKRLRRENEIGTFEWACKLGWTPEVADWIRDHGQLKFTPRRDSWFLTESQKKDICTDSRSDAKVAKDYNVAKSTVYYIRHPGRRPKRKKKLK